MNPPPDITDSRPESSETLAGICDLARKTLLRYHSREFIDRNPALLAACIQACALEKAANQLSHHLSRLEQALGQTNKGTEI